MGDCYVDLRYDVHVTWKRISIWIHGLNGNIFATSIAEFSAKRDQRNEPHWSSGVDIYSVKGGKVYRGVIEGYAEWFFSWQQTALPAIPANARLLASGSRFTLLHPDWRKISLDTRRCVIGTLPLPGCLAETCCDWVCERVPLPTN